MPFRKIQGTDSVYSLLCFDKASEERSDDPDGTDGRLSKRLLKLATTELPSHIFLFSHGWKGDVPAAVDQYDRWIKAVASLIRDQHLFNGGRFSPWWIGLHWPSLPWGDDEFGAAGGSFDTQTKVVSGTALQQRYLERLGDTPEICNALETIFREERVNAAAVEMPSRVAKAYEELNASLGLGEAGEGAAPGDDREPFNPVKAFQMGQAQAQAAGFGGINWGGLLSPLRQLSFWTMKKRARTVGEQGMHSFMAQLMQVCPDARVHLMGHSFGCIVTSSLLCGPGGQWQLPRPVDSLVLAQGALSLWAYSPSIAKASGRAGYFHRVMAESLVRGAIVTTTSKWDKALRAFYPLGAGAARQVDFALNVTDPPKYGAMGTFGARGLLRNVQDKPMLSEKMSYGFQPRTLYNLEGSEFIRKGHGASGAHNDIDGPQIAHAICEAAMVGKRPSDDNT
jgi:pimeloyl-ACP methyl ester carboxylesterase